MNQPKSSALQVAHPLFTAPHRDPQTLASPAQWSLGGSEATFSFEDEDRACDLREKGSDDHVIWSQD